MKKISFVIPCYNEEESLAALYTELVKLFTEIERKYNVEVIMVNDGSRDKTQDMLFDIHSKDKRFKVINFSRNFGHQVAVTAGLDYAKGDAVVIMDADLQDPPNVVFEMIKKWEEGYEVVYGQRKEREGESMFKRFTAYVFYRILDSLAEVRIPKDTGDFRLMDQKVVDAVRKFREKNRFLRGIVAYVGFKQTAVLFDRPGSIRSVTHYPLRKMIRLALDGITSFSTFPLKVISTIGFSVSLLSLLGIVYAVYQKVMYPDITVAGWTFTVIAIFFIGGVQMLMLGILGTYIGRIYSEVQNRPLYIVSSILDDSNTDS
jgi:dolichol-phosphate mannosyltransferase